MGQETKCPVTKVKVVKEGESQVVILTLTKALPSSCALDSVTKSWIQEAGSTLNVSTVAIPKDRTWWHGARLEDFGDIVRDSLQVGTDGKCQGVYSFAGPPPPLVYQGHVFFSFTSSGMVHRLVPDSPCGPVIPEGAIGFFESAKGRQWVHHPKNIKLTGARLEFLSFCDYLAVAFEKVGGVHPYSPQLHQALTDIVGLKAPSYDADDQAYRYDFEGPHETKGGSKRPRSGRIGPPDSLQDTYGAGYGILLKCSNLQDAEALKKDFAKRTRVPPSNFEQLWSGQPTARFRV